MSKHSYTLFRWSLCVLLASFCISAFAEEETAEELFKRFTKGLYANQASFERDQPETYLKLVSIIQKVIELEPKNPEYRLSSLYFNVLLACLEDQTVGRKLEIYRQFITDSKAFKADFPDWPKRIYQLISNASQQFINLRAPDKSPCAWFPRNYNGSIICLSGRSFAAINASGLYIFNVLNNTGTASPKENANKAAIPRKEPTLSGILPLKLNILRTIYNIRLWIVVPLEIAWLAFTIMLLIKRRKTFFICLLVLPLLIVPLDILATYSGWKYRMELRESYATTPYGKDSYDITKMPDAIQNEYARNDYHPRFRDIKAMLLGDAIILPCVILLGSGAWLLRKRKTTKENQPPQN